jgi:hypothetical protein
MRIVDLSFPIRPHFRWKVALEQRASTPVPSWERPDMGGEPPICSTWSRRAHPSRSIARSGSTGSLCMLSDAQIGKIVLTVGGGKE